MYGIIAVCCCKENRQRCGNRERKVRRIRCCPRSITFANNPFEQVNNATADSLYDNRKDQRLNDLIKHA